MTSRGRRRRLSAALLVVFLTWLALPAPSRADAWATWEKRPDPIFTGQYIASDPAILAGDDGYRMYYTCFVVPPGGFDPATVRAAICEARSDDGLAWQEVATPGDTHGLVLAGRERKWDEDLEAAFVIHWQGRYLLYYSGYTHTGGHPAQGYPAALAVATSDDGITFTRLNQGEPILAPTPGWYDSDAVYSPTIVEHDGELVMLYAGHCYVDCDQAGGVTLLAATSTDGITWTKRAEPVLTGATTGLDWTRDGVAEPALVQGPDDRWYLFFTGLRDEARPLGMATGETPVGPWDIRPDVLFEPGPAGSWDAAGDLAPAVLIEGDTVRMWFLGTTPEGLIAIGYAESTWPLRKLD